MAFVLRMDDGAHRQSTFLELFFDLAFVICVATLSHHVAQTPNWPGVAAYLALFVPVWWLWNQFTWYASHFDSDDRLFRLFMLCGVAGTLCLAGGIHPLFHGHPTQFVLSYIGLHLLIGMGWCRAHRHLPTLRPYIRLKTLGASLGCLLWGSSLFFAPPTQYLIWFVGISIQLLMPVFAWMTVKEGISVHYHHLHERLGLFTIIILGETLVAVVGKLSPIESWSQVGTMAIIFLVIASVWWRYFDWDYSPVNLKVTSQAFAFNYGHLFVYMSLGLIAAGTAMPVVGAAIHSFAFQMQLFGLSIFFGSLWAMNRLSKRDPSRLRSHTDLALTLLFGAGFVACFFVRFLA